MSTPSPQNLIVPGHWLFNAGMIGLLQVLEESGGIDLSASGVLRNDGTIDGRRLYWRVALALGRPAPVPKEIAPLRRLHWWYIEHEKYLNGPPQPQKKKTKETAHSSSESEVKEEDPPFKTPEGRVYFGILGRIFGNVGDYKNLFHHTDRKNVALLADTFSNQKIFHRSTYQAQCPLSGFIGYEQLPVELKWLEWMFPSSSNFPNAIRGGIEAGALRVSSPALHLILFHHFALHEVGKSELFINAPSFRLMYDLNKLLKSYISPAGSPQELLATSLIQYAARLQRMLSAWTYQNIELIVKREKTVESFTLPPDVARLLVDPTISRALVRLDSPVILSLVLNRRFGELEEVVHRLLRIRLKGTEKSKGDSKLLNDYFPGQGDRALRNISALLQLTTKIREIYTKPNSI